jgi:hypothetical protein
MSARFFSCSLALPGDRATAGVAFASDFQDAHDIEGVLRGDRKFGRAE